MALLAVFGEFGPSFCVPLGSGGTCLSQYFFRGFDVILTRPAHTDMGLGNTDFAQGASCASELGILQSLLLLCGELRGVPA